MTRRLAALFLLIATFSFADTDMPSIVAAAAESKTHRHREGSTKQDRLMTFDNPDTYIFGTITKGR